MKVCARDHGVQCFVLCTLCTQQMWSTLTAFLIFGSIMSSLEGVFACEHQREMNKNCQLPVHTRLKLNCWNRHLRSLCADLRFSPRVFPETWRRGLYLYIRFGTEPLCWQCFLPVKPSSMSVKCYFEIFVRNTSRGFAFCPLKLHVCFINTRGALGGFYALDQFICNRGIYFAYSSDIMVGFAL